MIVLAFSAHFFSEQLPLCLVVIAVHFHILLITEEEAIFSLGRGEGV